MGSVGPMTPLLLWLWILALHTDGQQHPDPGEGAVQPRWSSPGVRGAAPPLIDGDRPAAGQRSREKVPGWQTGGRGAKRLGLLSPHTCGRRCCVGWTLSPKTRRCTKSRCVPRCQNRALCQRSNRCVCRRGFHGYRCEFSTTTMETSNSGSDMFSVKTEDAVAETKQIQVGDQVPQKRERMKPKMKESPTKMESEPEFTSLWSWTKGSQDQTETPMSDSQSLTEDPQTRTEETESSEPRLKKPLGKTSKPEGVLGHLDSHSGPTLEERETLNPKLDLSYKHEDKGLGGHKPSGLHSDPDLRGTKSPDDRATRRKERTEEVKTGKNRPLSLREAQSVLLRTTLSQVGRGDKLASLLMEHIEKERNKLGPRTSSSPAKTSVSSFHTQRGQYTVHVSAPSGQSSGSGGC